MWTCVYCNADLEGAIIAHLAAVGLLRLMDRPFPCPACGRALLVDVDLEIIGAEGH